MPASVSIRRTATAGTARSAPPIRTSTTCSPRRATGRSRTTSEPPPSVDVSRTSPPRRATAASTASRPTPRPETSEAASRVENPGRKTSRSASAAGDEGKLLIEGSVAGRPVAFSVDRVEGEVELLVRPLPRRARVSPMVDGAALLPSGEPIAVLAPQALLGRETAGRLAPIAPMAPIAATGLLARAGAPRELTRLLLVDDSRVTREMERRILEDAGFRVEVAADGDEALRRLAVEAFDCLVTDIEMPNLDGFELTAQLRQIERFAHLPIVVVSTRERSEDRLRGLRAGADAYLTKQSLVATDLVETVRRLTGS